MFKKNRQLIKTVPNFFQPFIDLHPTSSRFLLEQGYNNIHVKTVSVKQLTPIIRSTFPGNILGYLFQANLCTGYKIILLQSFAVLTFIFDINFI